MKNFKSIITFSLFLTLVFISCTDLKAVRDYAGESAKLAAYTELTTRFRDTYEREQPYLSGDAYTIAQVNDRKRKSAYEDLIKIHTTIFLYMQTLAKLAGAETFDFSKEIDSLGSGIKSHPELGIEDKHVDAISNISKVITKWATAFYQENEVKKMVKESDKDLQTTLNVMKSLIRYYKKNSDNEKKIVLGLYKTEISFLDASKDKLLATLARVHMQSKESEYAKFDVKYKDIEKGIKNISDGHNKILENIDELSGDKVKDMITKVSNDIMAIRENLEIIKSD